MKEKNFIKQPWLLKLTGKMIKAIEFLAFTILSGLLLMGFFTSAQLHLDLSEKVVFARTSPFTILFVLLLVLILLAINKKVQKIPYKYFMVILLTVFVIFSLAFMLVLQPLDNIQIRADALAVIQGANEFKQGIYTSITQNNGYFNLNPHQLGLATLEQLYFSITSTLWIGFLANILYALGIIVCLVKLYQLFFTNRRISNFMTIMLLAFLPLFFHVGFMYGLLPGLFFCLLGFYHLSRFQLRSRWWSLPLAFIFLVIGVSIRKNYFIFIIAILLVELFVLLQKYQTKKLFSLLAILLVVPMSSFLINSYYGSKIGSKLPSGTPNTAYVAMGLRDDENHPSLGGWWDGYNSNILSQHHFNHEEAGQAAKDEIKNRVTYLASHPSYAYHFFSDKVISTWLEPTFESVWSAVPLLPKVEYKNTIVRSIVDEGTLYHIIYSWSLVITLLIYGFGAVRLFHLVFLQKEQDSIFELYSVLFFLGGFFFHLIWETKSQYAFVYVLLLIPLAVTGFDDVQSWVATYWNRRRVNRERIE